jgi:hypothetical protein
MPKQKVAQEPNGRKACAHLAQFIKLYTESSVIVMAVPRGEVVIAACVICPKSKIEMIDSGREA